jgi:hypothetical protein
MERVSTFVWRGRGYDNCDYYFCEQCNYSATSKQDCLKHEKSQHFSRVHPNPNFQPQPPPMPAMSEPIPRMSVGSVRGVRPQLVRPGLGHGLAPQFPRYDVGNDGGGGEHAPEDM